MGRVHGTGRQFCVARAKRPWRPGAAQAGSGAPIPTRWELPRALDRADRNCASGVTARYVWNRRQNGAWLQGDPRGGRPSLRGGREAHRGSVRVGGCCGARRYGQHRPKGKDGAEAPARAEGGWQCHAQMWGARAGSASLREGALGPLLDPWSLRCQCDRQMETLRSRGTRGSEASAVNVASRPGSA